MIFIIPIIIVIVYLITFYNGTKTIQVRIKASIQEIANQLKRQADLIPNLEESAMGYMKQEKGIFTDLTNARKSIDKAVSSGDVQKMADAGSEFASVLPKLQVIMESNPEIKSDNVVSRLMDELRDTSDKVMYARRLVIDLTADFNVRRVSFPSNLIANMFKFEEQPGLITPDKGEHLEVSSEETKAPKIRF